MLFSWKLFENYLRKSLFIVLAFFLIVLTVKFFIFDFGFVDGASMDPTFSSADTFLSNKFTYLIHPPARFDIIQIVDSVNQVMLTKRIIGLPGETITLKDGSIYISDDHNHIPLLLFENYLPPNTVTTSTADNAIAYSIGTNEYFVLGDNRSSSIDSRQFGPVSRSDIIGKIVYNITKNRPL